ncbi:MAG: hypothetical protein NT001_00275 [Candidatus Woesearchaeota archaeon]|nr:hypothetical protein [Candidatus Woesearchaeota archaeon]
MYIKNTLKNTPAYNQIPTVNNQSPSACNNTYSGNSLENRIHSSSSKWLRNTAAAVVTTLLISLSPIYRVNSADEQKCQIGNPHLQPKIEFKLDCQGEGVRTFKDETPMRALEAYAKTKAPEFQQGWLKQAKIYCNAVYGEDAMNRQVTADTTVRICVSYGDKPCTPISRGIPGVDNSNQSQYNNNPITIRTETIPMEITINQREKAKKWCEQDDKHEAVCIGAGGLGTGLVVGGIIAIVNGLSGGNGSGHNGGGSHSGNNGDPGDK